MLFPQAPAIGDEVTNDLTGAVYRWDGLMWHNVPVEAKGARAEGFEEDLAKLVADQQRQDFALLQEKRERQDVDSQLLADIEDLGDVESSLIDAVQDLHNYDDGPIREDLFDLQEAFDAAVIAAQEGAENLTLELQSYSKKTHNHDGTYSALGHTHDYLPLAGGDVTGMIRSTGLFKTTRDEGYAFQVRPNNGDTTAYIHTSGHGVFSGRVEVDGVDLAKVNHTHPNLATADHGHPDLAAADHTHAGFAAESHTHAELSPANHTHSSYAVSNHNHDASYAAKSHTHADYAKQAVWKAVSHQSAELLEVGEFFIASNENLYLHPKSENGVDLGVGGSATSSDVTMLVSVHALQGNSMYCVTANQIKFNNERNKYIRISKAATHYRQSLNAGTKYALNIPGFTP